ncbi:hypothetical protein [Alteromonas lipotrueae]|uniref:hypothetical protein n=1 Tax=Alteromonas lipotrueae TaxID=2803814 RepID=UPI00215CDFC3|nr:hypothetical protein [Alteromonas lipotrueae]
MKASDNKPRGIRNNNPLNIRVGNDWQGEVSSSSDSEFEQFNTPEMGIRAAAKLLKNYRDKYQLKTIAQIVTRWAPDTENKTGAYIASIENQTGLGRDVVLGDADYIDVIAAMIYHENGEQPYSEQVIYNGFSAGFYA